MFNSIFIIKVKFVEYRSLFANAGPGFFHSQKTSIGFYYRDCMNEIDHSCANLGIVVKGWGGVGVVLRTALTSFFFNPQLIFDLN